ncbi:MAG: efflux RND transporter periplasmic adaptor subunit [Xanthobacteraceae bacterium]|nr:efflux RND transporter periplasmic adaptor subunit [Xanthobacteraceae bacterium]
MDSPHPETSRTAVRATILTLLVIAVVGFGGLYLYRTVLQPGPHVAKEEPNASGVVPLPNEENQSVDLTDKQAASVRIVPAATHTFETLRTAVGTIDFNENMNVQVFSQYSGKILQAFYNIGDDVKQGDTLFTIDSPDLLQAESTLLAAAGVLELQTRTLSRVTNLLKSGGAAQKDVDQSTSDQQTAEGNYKAARDAVRIFGKTDAEIDAILSKRKVDSTLLVPSPITGRVVTRNAAPGFLTQPGTAPAPFAVADLATKWMLANVIEADAPFYRLGQQVEVTVPSYPERVFKGHVTALGSNIDPTTHRLLVRSEIEDPQNELRPGMFASFLIRMGDAATTIGVPVESVVREGDGTMTVWVTTDRRHFTKRVVKLGIPQQEGLAQILSGLKPGEQVVSEGAVFLSNKLLLGTSG